MIVTSQHQFNVVWKDLVLLAFASSFSFSDNDEDGATIETTAPNVKYGGN